jgi:hypothetical protein
MERKARLIHHSPITGIEIWCDEEVWPEIMEFFSLGTSAENLTKENRTRQKRLRHVLEVVVRNVARKDIIEKECVDLKHCAWVLKMFQGSQNTRIICQRVETSTRDSIVMARLIPKKKSQSLDGSAKNLIRTVSQFEYDLSPIIP